MYGRIGKMTAVAGQRDILAEILLEGTRAMPSCLSYIVAMVQAIPMPSGSRKSGTVPRVTGPPSRSPACKLR